MEFFCYILHFYSTKVLFLWFPTNIFKNLFLLSSCLQHVKKRFYLFVSSRYAEDTKRKRPERGVSLSGRRRMFFVWRHYTEGVRKTRQRPLSSRATYPLSCNVAIIFCNAERLMPVSSCRYACVAWSSICIVRRILL